MRPTKERLLTISEAAEMLGVHANTLRSWADKGLVPHVRLPSGYRRFRPNDMKKVQDDMGLLPLDGNPTRETLGS